jgi:NarL family two-component system response regulator LiaR
MPQIPQNHQHRPLYIAIVDDDVAFGHSILDYLHYDFLSQDDQPVEYAPSLNRQLFVSAEEALTAFALSTPDIVLMDIRLPAMSGIDCTRLLTQQYPAMMVIMMSSADDRETIIDALKAGAKGYINKLRCDEELYPALKSVMRGESPISPDIARTVITHIQSSSGVVLQNDVEKLSPRELQVMQSLKGGNTYQQTADELCVSIETVRTHARNVYKKLGVASYKQARKKIFKKK